MKRTNQVGKGWQVPFFSVWVGQAFSLLGSALVQFALVWWLTESTGSATVLAMATLMAVLPSVFLAPFTGALVDRWDRRLVMMVADALIALATVGLAGLFLVGAERVWAVYAVMFFRSAGGGFHWAAMQASTSLMVPAKHLSRVAGINQTLRGAVNIVGPPVGALLLQVVPLQGILAIDVGTALLAIAPLFLVHVPRPERGFEGESAFQEVSLLEDVREGLRYVRGWPGLFAVLLIAAVVNLLLTPASSLMPILVTDHFGGEALELGWLESAWGVGVVAGGLVLGAWGGFRRRILTSLMGLVGIGLGFLLVGLVPPSAFLLAVGGFFLAGVMNPITNGPIFSIIQASVDPGMQGRVFTLVQSMAAAATPIGMIIAGPVADALGVRLWYIVGGVGCMLMGTGSFFVPTIVHLEDDRDASTSEARPIPSVSGGCMDASQAAE
jgi:DHA3 family macrolide efflux protein-like MFS transporter